MSSSLRRPLLLSLFVTLLFLVSSSALAVWPLPQYDVYPCGGGVNPPSNCSDQIGGPDLNRQVKLSERSVTVDPVTSCTPVSGQFGGFCDGPNCTSSAGFCRKPSIL